ncbi:MAG: nucleoside deaminase [Saprospiraceae bacterium]|nr:nucleoside deaminase [Saprospiraceae bacterium]
MSILGDDHFMHQALLEARRAFDDGEVPVGAVVVCENRIIARSHNQVEKLQDPSAHAEMLAITAACTHLGSKVLNQCTLYVTLEPCPMCAGALYWSRPVRVVYGAGDEKRGFMRYGKEVLHPSTKLEYGVRHDECAALLKEFFALRREIST